MYKINLLYIIEGGVPGGAETNLLTVIKALDKAQYKVMLCLFRPSEFLEHELKDLGISFFILNFSGKWDIISIFKLVRFMQRERIDIAHTCLYTSNTFGRIAAILARIPIIIAWEQGEILEPDIPKRHFRMDNFLAKFTDCVMTCSGATKEIIIKNEGIPEQKIRVIYNCIDLTKFNNLYDVQATRNSLGIALDEILIGTVATLFNEIKGQEYTIRAMPQIIKAYPKTKLLLVGRDGSSKSNFIQTVNDLGIADKVIFTDFRKDIPELMNILDLYICSSNREAFGISIIEAMALKKAVVATRVFGIPEVVIDHKTGILVPAQDANAIAQAVIYLLADRERMRQMGEAGYQRVKKYFSSEAIIKDVDLLYKELLCKKSLKFQ